MTTYRALDIRQEGLVDWVTLSRPERLNALDDEMVATLRLFPRAGNCHERAGGRAARRWPGLCAGLDLQDVRAGADVATGLARQRSIAQVVMRMRRCPQPIISLVHGPACGGGFVLALASDIRIAGDSARMNVAFIRIGLSAYDIGVSYFLPRLVGVSVASELMMTGSFIHARPEPVATITWWS